MTALTHVPIGSVVKVIGGGTPSRTNLTYYGGDIPWVTPKDMKTWDIRGAQVTLTRLGLDSSPAKLIPANSVLIVVRSGVLKHTVPVGINRVPVAINQDMKALVCSEAILPAYLARFIKERSGEILRWVRATTADNFPIEKLKDLKIPLPPTYEQWRIAEVLDQADELRVKRRQAIALLDDLVQSIFLDMFGDPGANSRAWPEAPLGDLLDGIDSGQSPRCLDRPAGESEWGVLKLGAITRCEYFSTENKALPKEIVPNARHEVHAGDLLFSRKNTRELVAACALVRDTPPGLLLPDLIFRLRVRTNAPVDSSYLHRLLIYPSKRRKVQELASGSAGSMPNISKSRLNKLSIPIPPLRLQREFSDRILSIDYLRTTHQAQRDELDELFDSLQQRAFSWEL